MPDGVEARTHDPLWMLARQWQFGELKGDDAGSPMIAHLAVQTAAIAQYGSENGGRTAYDAKRVPLETIVEREPLPEIDRRSLVCQVEASLHFVRLLVVYGAGSIVQEYKKQYALTPIPDSQRAQWDQESARYAAIVAERVPDAKRLYSDFSQAFGPRGDHDGPLPAQPVVPDAIRQNVAKTARVWLKWYTDQGLSQPEAAAGSVPWNPERMEYSVTLTGQIGNQEWSLSAPEYFEGHLDWYSFVVDDVKAMGTAQPPSETLQLVPVPATYLGMPASRYWEFEDGHMNFSAVGGVTNEAALAVLLDFALIHGNDWFIVPLELDVGSLCRIESLIVTDTFGAPLRIRHCSDVDKPDSPWRMFCVSSRPNKEGKRTYLLPDVFFLPPVVAAGFESEAIEEVRLLRDEMANMAWAVERVVEGPAGLSLDRYEAFQERKRQEEQASSGIPEPSSPAATGTYHYRLGTEVPDYWIPLVPEARERGDVRSLRLRRAAMPRIGGNGLQGLLQPLGRLLEPERALSLYSEEVPREGARITRAYQYTRWIDGSSHLWLGRRKQVGKGEGSGGLRFDLLELT
jgi:hypothetical protein